MQEHIDRYKAGAEGLAGLAGLRQTAKADAAKAASELDFTDTAKSIGDIYDQRRTQKGELGGKK